MKITIEAVGRVVRVTIDDVEVSGAPAPNAVETQILKETKKMTGEVQRLRDDVASLTSVEQSATALIAGLAQQIRDNATDPAALSAIADQLEATQSDLAAAVTANTPAQGGGTPPPPADAGGGSTTTTTSGDGSGTTAGADTGTTTSDAGATGGDGAAAGTTAAPAGSTDSSGPSAADPTVDAGAGNDATAAQQDTTGTSGS